MLKSELQAVGVLVHIISYDRNILWGFSSRPQNPSGLSYYAEYID